MDKDIKRFLFLYKKSGRHELHRRYALMKDIMKMNPNFKKEEYQTPEDVMYEKRQEKK